MGRFVDHKDKRFGRLVVNSYIEGQTWSCTCDCGIKTKVKSGHLVSGNTTSCGCRKRSVLGESTTRHGMVGTRVYRIWKAMMTRCNNANTPRYKDYGGRGINVCESWRQFENFFADMGAPPDGASIDRKNNELGYYKENCRWSTCNQQNSNKRNSILFEGLPLKEWAARNNVSYGTAYRQFKQTLEIQ